MALFPQKPSQQAAFIFAGLAGASFLVPALFAAPAPGPSEAALKAIFLFHFTQFVEWPTTVFSNPDEPFVIGVLGEDPFKELLDQSVQNEQVRGRSIIVRRFEDPRLLHGCHLVYVSRGSEHAFAMAGFSHQPVLTVGESDEFLRDGGIIQFFSDHNRVRLRVNLKVARDASLEISSKLLRVAEVIGASKS